MGIRIVPRKHLGEQILGHAASEDGLKIIGRHDQDPFIEIELASEFVVSESLHRAHIEYSVFMYEPQSLCTHCTSQRRMLECEHVLYML